MNPDPVLPHDQCPDLAEDPASRLDPERDAGSDNPPNQEEPTGNQN